MEQDVIELIAAKIIRQACQDWLWAQRIISRSSPKTLERLKSELSERRYMTLRRAIRMREDCEIFFNSGWYAMLTDIPSSVILEKLHKRAEKGKWLL